MSLRNIIRATGRAEAAATRCLSSLASSSGSSRGSSLALVFASGIIIGTAGDRLLAGHSASTSGATDQQQQHGQSSAADKPSGQQQQEHQDQQQLPKLAGLAARARDTVAGTFSAHTQASASTSPGGCLSPNFIADAAAKAAPAVVNIAVAAPASLPGSSGSGFILESDGVVITNAHVVADAIQRQVVGSGGAPRSITVTLQDGRIFEGRLVAHDTISDLAVVRIDSDAPLPTVALGRSANLRAGEWVVALGSPLHLQNSVTAGIISCVDRKGVELGLAGARSEFIQTDAAINRGNSGGPLVDLQGRVIGISAMKAVAADGVSFCIPIDSAVEVIRQLREHGRVIRPYLGIKMLQLNRHNAAQFRKRDPSFPDLSEGILVPAVHPGSPAERAGLRPGDIIVGYAGAAGGATTGGLIKALGAHVGRPLELRVLRPGGKEVTLRVTALEATAG